MRPPNPTQTISLLLHTHKPHHHLSRPLLTPKYNHHPPARPSSTTPSTLLKTRTIPAPHTGHIRILSLNNPRTRNAISRQLLSELSAEINAVRKEVEDEERGVDRGEGQGRGVGIGRGTRVLIIESAVEEAFCAGADLKERRGMGREETTHFLLSLRTTLTTLSTLPIPTISAISSPALGGGFELALATTFRLATQTAQFALPETKLGIIPGAGGTYRLPALIGRSRALEVMLSGRRIGGVEAGRLGVVERVVKGEVGREAVRLAGEICEGSPGGVRGCLRAVGGGVGVEEREYDVVLGMGDRDEALRAFGEKRRAVFRGV